MITKQYVSLLPHCWELCEGAVVEKALVEFLFGAAVNTSWLSSEEGVGGRGGGQQSSHSPAHLKIFRPYR